MKMAWFKGHNIQDICGTVYIMYLEFGAQDATRNICVSAANQWKLFSPSISLTENYHKVSIL